MKDGNVYYWFFRNFYQNTVHLWQKELIRTNNTSKVNYAAIIFLWFPLSFIIFKNYVMLSSFYFSFCTVYEKSDAFSKR